MRAVLVVLALLAAVYSATAATCANGKGLTSPYEPTACCPKSCGSCGGKGCGVRKGGENACCGGKILAKNKPCGAPPCVIKPSSPPAPAACKSGLVNADKSVCCSSKCGGICGGKGCGLKAAGEAGCCASKIQASGKLCSKNPSLPNGTAGCILRATSSTTPTKQPTSPGSVCRFPNPDYVAGVGCTDASRTCPADSYGFTEYWNRGGARRAEFCVYKGDIKRCFDAGKEVHETSGGFGCLARDQICQNGVACDSFPMGGDQVCFSNQCQCRSSKFVLVGSLNNCEEKCGVAADGTQKVCVGDAGDYPLAACSNQVCKCLSNDAQGAPVKSRECPKVKTADGKLTYIPITCSGRCPTGG